MGFSCQATLKSMAPYKVGAFPVETRRRRGTQKVPPPASQHRDAATHLSKPALLLSPKCPSYTDLKPSLWGEQTEMWLNYLLWGTAIWLVFWKVSSPWEKSKNSLPEMIKKGSGSRSLENGSQGQPRCPKSLSQPSTNCLFVPLPPFSTFF